MVANDSSISNVIRPIPNEYKIKHRFDGAVWKKMVTSHILVLNDNKTKKKILHEFDNRQKCWIMKNFKNPIIKKIQKD